MNKINHEPIRIVVVDDHVLFREGLVAIIRSEPDLEIVGQAGTVKEAVAMIGSLKPDVVLMDFRLPDGTGVDATRAVLSEYLECKIVFLTMSEEDDDLSPSTRHHHRLEKERHEQFILTSHFTSLQNASMYIYSV